MKHIIMSENWKYSNEPFPAYRASLVYGRNKRDNEFLPVRGVDPVINYVVTAWKGYNLGYETLYVGHDKESAEAVKLQYDMENEIDSTWTSAAKIESSNPLLPENRFKIIKTKEKGTLLVVGGEDATNRCLLMVGVEGGFRGGCNVVSKATTATILKRCSASAACESGVEVAVLMEAGQTISFYSYGRRNDDIIQHTWNGLEIETKEYTRSEYESSLVSEEGETL